LLLHWDALIASLIPNRQEECCMRIKRMHFGTWPAFSALLSFFSFAGLASAQSTPAQNYNDDRSFQDRDDRRPEQARFDQFLDSHREIAEQLRKDPSLVNDPKFVKNHPALENYLKQHPGVSDALKDDPNAFMRQEQRYDRQEAYRDRTGQQGELARFDQFLDRHRDTAEQLRKDPSLVNNEKYLKNRPDLQAFLQEHPGVRQQIQNDPNGFMKREDRFDSRTDDVNRADRDRADRDRDDRATSDRDATNQGDRDATTSDRDRAERDAVNRADQDRDGNRHQLAQFDRFLDSHRETAEQLRKNPALIDDRQFLKDHPALQSYLQDHPEVREQVRQNPNAFMQQEARYDRREQDMNRQDHDRDAMNRGDRDDMFRDRGNNERFDRDSQHNHAASFGQFLGDHSNIAQQISKNPALVKNQDYLKDHPELQSYLTAHPEVRQELMANPQSFVKSAQQYNHNSQGVNGPGMKSPGTTPPTTDARPKATDSKPPMQ
jgi:hypothetical protein